MNSIGTRQQKPCTHARPPARMPSMRRAAPARLPVRPPARRLPARPPAARPRREHVHKRTLRTRTRAHTHTHLRLHTIIHNHSHTHTNTYLVSKSSPPQASRMASHGTPKVKSSVGGSLQRNLPDASSRRGEAQAEACRLPSLCKQCFRNGR